MSLPISVSWICSTTVRVCRTKFLTALLMVDCCDLFFAASASSFWRSLVSACACTDSRSTFVWRRWQRERERSRQAQKNKEALLSVGFSFSRTTLTDPPLFGVVGADRYPDEKKHSRHVSYFISETDLHIHRSNRCLASSSSSAEREGGRERNPDNY